MKWPLSIGREPAYEDDAVALFHGDCFDLPVPEIDALITDTPYSKKTHRGHASGVHVRDKKNVYRGRESKRTAATGRRKITYAPWSPVDVERFVALWAPRTRGWFVSITDDVLAPAWQAALSAAGRYVFAPLPFVEPGGRVRLVGDGPSSWTCWIIVARPSTRRFARWGTLDGAYIVPPGLGTPRSGELRPIVGGKPEWLLERLIEDYSRPGDVVCDPCAGGGTTGVAAKRLGRRALLIERDEAHIAIASKRVSETRQQLRLVHTERPAPSAEQLRLGGAGR